MVAILTLCGGFLLAVLWMDLMFDVQVLRHRDTTRQLPEETLRSIAGYYRRVTTDARPLSYLIGSVMITAIVVLVVQISRGSEPRWAHWTSLPLCAAPILLAMLRVLPNAVRLGSREDTIPQQSDLARAICRDHLLCAVGISGFLALQLIAALM